MGGARVARAWLWATVALTAGAFAVAVMSAPAGFCVMYLMAVWFSLPVFVFASPYAAVSGMTIALLPAGSVAITVNRSPGHLEVRYTLAG